jgi:uncharacterized protein (TIGR00730 family)
MVGLGKERDLAPRPRSPPDGAAAAEPGILMVRELRRICVFCGASPGRDPRYRELAAETGRKLARRGIGIVYGGGRVGLMGALADGALDAGGEVIGVIPRGLVDRELAHPDVTELRVVETLHERKAVMAELADAFVGLPGGLGTLEELSEVVSWAQLDLHQKPCGVLDPGGYFRELIAFLDHAVAEGFLAQPDRERLVVGATLDELLTRFAQAPAIEGRWER